MPSGKNRQVIERRDSNGGREFHSYNIVYQAESQETVDAQSYTVVFSLNAPRGKGMRFAEFLDAYCKLNNKVAVASSVNNVFPDFKHAHQQRSHVFGNLKQVIDASD